MTQGGKKKKRAVNRSIMLAKKIIIKDGGTVRPGGAGGGFGASWRRRSPGSRGDAGGWQRSGRGPRQVWPGPVRRGGCRWARGPRAPLAGGVRAGRAPAAAAGRAPARFVCFMLRVAAVPVTSFRHPWLVCWRQLSAKHLSACPASSGLLRKCSFSVWADF